MPADKVAVVDGDICTGCGICEDACSEKAISVEDYAVVDETKCNGCGSCVDECPNEAITLKDKSKD